MRLFTNECIKINKNGKIENESERKIRIKLIMFGGLMSIDNNNNNNNNNNKEEQNKNNKNNKKIKKKKK